MVDRTILALPAGKKVTVPRLFKRALQVALAVALTSGVFLVMIVGNGMIAGRNASLQTGMNAWLAFIKRPDILPTITLTALVTVLVVYWMRNHERRGGS
jgi:ABC-type sulfate transport system permease subunit